MYVVILLGENDEYLRYQPFEFKFKAELFIGSLENLMLANIEKTLPLKERLQLAPAYLPFAGRLQDIELIELSKEKEDER